MDYHCFTFSNAIALLEDVIKVVQLEACNDCQKENKAQDMKSDIHNGKYGSWEAMWTQVEIAIATIKR